MTEAQNSKRLFWKFDNLDLELISDFDIRISDFSSGSDVTHSD